MNILPKGLWPVMITPFTNSNHIDLDGLERLTNMYLDAGADGMFANCLSSEMYQLTSEERLLLARSVVKLCENKVPVVATGTFSRDQLDNVEFIKKMYDTGVNAVILITSLLVEPDENESILKTRIEKLMSETGNIPLGVYECPIPYKRLLSPAMMQWLASTGRFIYHKDTSCNSVSLQQKSEVVKDTNFGLYNADTTTALDSLDFGSRGISPISANFYPEPYSYLLKEYFTHGRTEKLNRLHAFLTMMDRVTHTFYPYCAKFFLQKRGLKIGTTTRIPTETLPNVDNIRLNALMDSFKALAEMFEIKLVL
ncbi:4-hydroxy-tetrahydrodipicolinate synthase [Emticicia aquatica]|uniref:4-hydroxy-tetrahydrodipicolinate synthase n=1 Tax=Emticicia aquatica TaxID=1681835 RepID=A0ABN8EPJ7_9BACT|nr:dihydrodipicolinate synthase family protein [Emticicia aquatica]CAH0994798.1 4-hydroxy-tetrahydrodipicolinate synthase [Emticicia aquatica]